MNFRVWNSKPVGAREGEWKKIKNIYINYKKRIGEFKVWIKGI